MYLNEPDFWKWFFEAKTRPVAMRKKDGGYTPYSQFILDMQVLKRNGVDPSNLVSVIEHREYKNLLESYKQTRA